MKQKNNLTVALYERLSHDDEQQGPSKSDSLGIPSPFVASPGWEV